MFKRKKDKRALELNAAEKRLLIQAMIHFRNKLITQGTARTTTTSIVNKREWKST